MKCGFGSSASGVTRRRLLAATAIGATACLRTPRPIAGSFVDQSHLVGHRIRDGGGFPRPTEVEKVPIVIVGGGIAGLSAAWRLQKRGFNDFVLLEMEDQAGGNSRYGEDPSTAYPWGAHYIPIPDRRIPLVEELFEELGVLRNGRWDTQHISREPLHRLFINGGWQPELEPGPEAPQLDRDQFDRFWERMEYFRQGGELTIPIRQPVETAYLDQLSMKSWMIQEGFFSERLLWYVDYGCRDDYGTSSAETSAWAGIHYFAARSEDDAGFLTWPEGNGWIVKRLLEIVGAKVRTGSPVVRISRYGKRLMVATPQRTYDCERVIFAAPTFLAPYLIPELDLDTSGFVYVPWYTANLVLDRPTAGPAPAWENLIYNSPGLGYVDARHQRGGGEGRTVWTYYRALTEASPATARQSLLDTPWEVRVDEVFDDLAQAHPDIRDCVERVDIMRMGHAMISPRTGFLTSPQRQAIANLEGPIQFANSDLSGISIFEEAQYRGVQAAERVLGQLS